MKNGRFLYEGNAADLGADGRAAFGRRNAFPGGSRETERKRKKAGGTGEGGTGCGQPFITDALPRRKTRKAL